MQKNQPTVLLASADPMWRVACVERLLNTGCDVHTAATGVRATDDLRKHQYDIVVFDDSMPDISVFEMHLNVRDLARNSPRQLIAVVDGTTGRDRMNKGTEVEVGTPGEVLNRLAAAVYQIRARDEKAETPQATGPGQN